MRQCATALRPLSMLAAALRTKLIAVEDEHIRSLQGVPAGRDLLARPLESPGVRDALATHRDQSAVIMVRGKSLERLRPWEPVLGPGTVEKLVALEARHRAFVHALERGQRSVVFVMVADSNEEFEKLGAQLVAAEAPFEVLTLGK